MIVIGIDPGITGAIAAFADGKLAFVKDLPVIEIAVGKGTRRQMVPATLSEIIYCATEGSEDVSHVFLEHVASRPKEGAVGAFSFGRGFGQIEGVLAGLNIPYTLVTPAVWKKALKVSADKGHARMRASREFPEFASQFARVKDDGRAEACLIGLYGVSA